MKLKFTELGEFSESDKSLKLGQFKDPICYLCLPGTVVASLSLTQNNSANTAIFFNFTFFVFEFGEDI